MHTPFRDSPYKLSSSRRNQCSDAVATVATPSSSFRYNHRRDDYSLMGILADGCAIAGSGRSQELW